MFIKKYSVTKSIVKQSLNNFCFNHFFICDSIDYDHRVKSILPRYLHNKILINIRNAHRCLIGFIYEDADVDF